MLDVHQLKAEDLQGLDAETAFAGRRMTAIIDPDNQPSVRVARKLGFAEAAARRPQGRS